MAKPARDRWRILGVPLEIHEEPAILQSRAASIAGVPEDAFLSLSLAKRSLDARRSRGILRYVCHVDVDLPRGWQTDRMRKAIRAGKVRPAPGSESLVLPRLDASAVPQSAVVVGAGPAGLFAALTLAVNGAGVTLIDRGASLADRHKKLVPFHRGGSLDLDTNLLFGEGGAGTYSDGKLYTRVQDPLEVTIIEELVQAGAPEGIRFDGRAHIGTDRLHRILPKLRQRFLDVGGRIHWHTRLEGLVCQAGLEKEITAVKTSGGEMRCDALFLALGHSARDTVSQLVEQGLVVARKPFQFGVRVEHPQELINSGRFGDHPHAESLGAASYNLANKGSRELPGAHTFCMCPGGKIVASISEEGGLCTNGMSNSTHSSPWANAAVVTTIQPEEFDGMGSGPLAGYEYQRHFEAEFFDAGGRDYTAPAQWVPDFLNGEASRGLRDSSYTFGVRPGRIDQLLGPRIHAALAHGLQRFERMLPGFSGPEAILVGVESRSSSPVRLPRDRDTFLAEGFRNCYPVGEGAGYAGGIMSAAIDGARAAHVLLAPTLRNQR